MPVTLADAQKLTQDKLVRVVIDEFRKDNLLDMMVFDDNVALAGGSTMAYVYNRVTTYATAAGRAINSEYEPQEAVTTPITTYLKVFGGSFQIDRVIQAFVKGVTDQLSFQLQQKIEATKSLFADQFINGDAGVDPLQFDGLDKALTGSTTEANTGADIDLDSSADMDSNFKVFMDALDQWLATMDGTPTGLFMNRKLKAIMNGLARRSNYFTQSEDAFGRPVMMYAGIPFIVLGDKPGTSLPIIPITAGATSIYAARIGLDGVHAVTPDGRPYSRIRRLPGIRRNGNPDGHPGAGKEVWTAGRRRGSDGARYREQADRKRRGAAPHFPFWTAAGRSEPCRQ